MSTNDIFNRKNEIMESMNLDTMVPLTEGIGSSIANFFKKLKKVVSDFFKRILDGFRRIRDRIFRGGGSSSNSSKNTRNQETRKKADNEEEARKRAEEEFRRKEEEFRRAEEEFRREAEEEARKAEEEARKAEEEFERFKKEQEEERKKREEEDRKEREKYREWERKYDDYKENFKESRKKAEEERRKQKEEYEEYKRKEEEKRKRAEEARKKAEEERRKQEEKYKEFNDWWEEYNRKQEEERKRAEEERRKREERERKRAEEERRKQEEYERRSREERRKRQQRRSSGGSRNSGFNKWEIIEKAKNLDVELDKPIRNPTAYDNAMGFYNSVMDNAEDKFEEFKDKMDYDEFQINILNALVGAPNKKWIKKQVENAFYAKLGRKIGERNGAEIRGKTRAKKINEIDFEVFFDFIDRSKQQENDFKKKQNNIEQQIDSAEREATTSSDDKASDIARKFKFTLEIELITVQEYAKHFINIVNTGISLAQKVQNM